jgi:hypothetical protein
MGFHHDQWDAGTNQQFEILGAVIHDGRRELAEK